MSAGRKILPHGAKSFRDELARGHDIRSPVELDVGNGESDRTGGTDAADTGHSIDRGLDRKGDVLFHFVCGETRCLSHDDHGRRVQFRKDIHRGGRNPGDHRDQQDGGHEQDQRGMIQGELD